MMKLRIRTLAFSLAALICSAQALGVSPSSDADKAAFINDCRGFPGFVDATAQKYADPKTSRFFQSATPESQFARLAFENLNLNPIPVASAVALFNIYEQRADIALNKAPATDLTELQIVAIRMYTSTAYKDLNGELDATKGLPRKWLTLYSALDQALANLPPYLGVTLHGGYMPQSFLSNAKVGQPVHFSDYISASTDYQYKGPVEMKIRSKTGRNIQAFSLFQYEHEVLFPRGLTFVITEIILPTATDGSYHISMDEQ